ncbi:MAG: ATP-dependent DNA ligase [Rhodocyclaceae bacterium]|nr:ATP-dependent DNA ligase [Rhodocyclaceae bacterium]MCA3021053.1 ATP-dependent DNA ligase [Rhodocyclaceae bacterium]MCA3054689.1 ATP-dependent DNA ligase [Rhodocyclaceae bacterium]
MKDFAALFDALDQSTATGDKVAALTAYFREADPADAAWAVYFLTGNRPKQAVPSKRLHQIAAEVAGLPDWLFADCYDQVGDLAETIALILPPAKSRASISLSVWVTERLLPLRQLDEAAQRAALTAYWSELAGTERFLFNKLITGGFRVGVSTLLVVRALANVSGVDAKVISHRLAGDWQPTAQNFSALVGEASSTFDVSQPYPFFLAHALSDAPYTLGNVHDWQAEWKWDGIRGQLIKRQEQLFLWSRGEELVSAQFPEIIAAAARLPDGVLDGEILAMREGSVMPFTALQKRLGRKNPGKKIQADTPVAFVAYDLLEVAGEDWRQRPLHERRTKLHEVVYSIVLGADERHVIQLSDIVRAPSWATLALARDQSRKNGTEGLMLKRRDSAYGVGRTATGKGLGNDWWKWKVDPFTIDCVLMYAQRGHGKRANLYTDYTFGIWKSNKDGQFGSEMPENARQLVTFAKAYSGLTDEEIREVDVFIRKNTLEKFGPVRTVKAGMVFELAFEGIQRSNRHKSGFAVRFPRITRIRYDKKIEDADSVELIAAMMVP